MDHTTQPDEPTLAHERFDAYRYAVEFLAVAVELDGAIPRGTRALGDQLRRAALSVGLNIAEGTGRTAGPDRRRFYAIARGSAFECGAILDACRVLGIGNEGDIRRGKALLVRVVKILSTICLGASADGKI